MKPLNSDITTKIAQKIGLAFVSEKEAEGNVCMANSSEVRLEFKEIFSSIDVFDYIHGVLHSSANQAKQKDDLEIELMKIPLPIDLSTFQKYVNLGAEIRRNPLLQTPNTKGNYTEFSLEGEYIVAK